jgi:hypothetical protein
LVIKVEENYNKNMADYLSLEEKANKIENEIINN